MACGLGAAALWVRFDKIDLNHKNRSISKSSERLWFGWYIVLIYISVHGSQLFSISRPWEAHKVRGSSKSGKKWKKVIFFQSSFFSSKSLNFFTNAWNSMDDGLNRGNEQKISQFYKNSILEHVNVLGMFCLICIIKFTCPIKKLHGSARPETSLKLLFSVWALRWYASL